MNTLFHKNETYNTKNYSVKDYMNGLVITYDAIIMYEGMMPNDKKNGPDITRIIYPDG